jgi:AraC-like DNA-binding protein
MKLSSRHPTNSLHKLTSVFEDLHIASKYDGLIYLYESAYTPPILSPHQHHELEANLIVRGSITYVLDSKRYTFHEGTLLWLFPWQKHQMVKHSGDAQFFVVVFKPKLIERASRQGDRYNNLKNPGVEETEVLSTALKPKAFKSIRRTMESLMEDSIDPGILNREAGFGVNTNFRFKHKDPDWLNAGLRLLLLLCWRNQGEFVSQPDEAPMHPAVLKALDVLEHGDAPTPGMDQLAALCCVSTAYLSRIFHKQIGVTLGQYRNSMKLGRFWKAYHSRRQSNITEASYAAGFGSYAQFFRVFKAAYGQGPREFLTVEK